MRTPFHFLYQAVSNAHNTLRLVGELLVVRDEDNRLALGVQALEQLHDLHAGARIERAGGLVGQDDLRLAHQRTGDGHALLLASGQLVRQVVLAPFETHERELLAGTGVGLFQAYPGIAQRQLHVLERRELAQQIKALEHEPYLFVADGG